MAQQEMSPFSYLSYVTLREAWDTVRSIFFAWIVLSAIIMVFIWLSERGAAATQPIWSALPKPIFYILGFAVFTWIVRGEAETISIPKSFRGWLVLNLIFVVFIGAFTILPGWAMVPFYIGVLCFFNIFDELSGIGKNNYDRLQEHREAS